MPPSTEKLTSVAVASLLNRRARRHHKATVEPLRPTPSKVSKKKKKEVVVVKRKEDGLSAIEKNLKKIGVKDRGLDRRGDGDVREKILETRNAKKKAVAQGAKKSKKESDGFVFASEDDDSDSD